MPWCNTSLNPEAVSIAPLVPVHTEYVLNETIIGVLSLDN